jgi:hypothetical protein
MLHPGFFTDADLAECSPLARIFFEGLWCEADREGRLKNDHRELKAKILPYDNCDARELLGELERVGAVQRYEVDGVALLSLPNFHKYQHPHQREVASVLPAPPPRPGKGKGQPAPSPEKVVPSRAESVTVSESVSESVTVQAPAKKPREAKPKKPPDPRLGPLIGRLKASYFDVTGRPLVPTDPDVAALRTLLTRGDDDEIDRRWRKGLNAGQFETGKCASFLKLLMVWPELAVERAARASPDPDDGIIQRPTPEVCAVCGDDADELATDGFWACRPHLRAFVEWREANNIEKPWEHAAAWVQQQRASAGAAA